MSPPYSDDDIIAEVIERKKFTEPDWDNISSLSVNAILFKAFAGNPISFHVMLSNVSVKDKYKNIITTFGGKYVDLFFEMSDRTVLIIEDNSVTFYDRPSFKASYITDCILKNRLLDIKEYLHNHFTYNRSNFMNIIFWENETFQQKIIERCVDISDSSEEEVSRPYKHTREMYSRNEKISILKFLLSRKKLSGIRGDVVWRKMEKRGVCPKRTYQSMKNHFLKTMINQLDSFEFLSVIDKKMLKNSN